MTKVCDNCNFVVSDNDLFCSRCGNKLEHANTDLEERCKTTEIERLAQTAEKLKEIELKKDKWFLVGLNILCPGLGLLVGGNKLGYLLTPITVIVFLSFFIYSLIVNDWVLFGFYVIFMGIYYHGMLGYFSMTSIFKDISKNTSKKSSLTDSTVKIIKALKGKED